MLLFSVSLGAGSFSYPFPSIICLLICSIFYSFPHLYFPNFLLNFNFIIFVFIKSSFLASSVLSSPFLYSSYAIASLFSPQILSMSILFLENFFLPIFSVSSMLFLYCLFWSVSHIKALLKICGRPCLTIYM